jgi:tetratricopeptide (TPR) repeat protein
MGRPGLLSGALDTLGATGSLLDGYRGVMAPQGERLELIPQLDDVAEKTDIYGTSAWGLGHIGEFRESAKFGEMGMEIVEGMGHMNIVPGGFLAYAHFRLGEWDRFWETVARVDALFEEGRPLRYHAHRVYGIAAYVSQVTGDPLAADRHLERLDRSQAEMGTVGVSGPRLWIVGVLVRRGAFAEARERLAVVDPVRDIQNRDLTHEAWAEVIAAEATWDEAPAIVREARAWAEGTGLRFLPAVADRLEGQAALATGDLDKAVSALERARATFVELEASWDRARTELALAHVHVALGQRAAAAEKARSARETFTTLGAAPEIAQAEELVAAGGAKARTR